MTASRERASTLGAALLFAATILVAPVRQTRSDPELTLLTSRALLEHGSTSLEPYWAGLDERVHQHERWKTFVDFRDRSRHGVYPIGTSVMAMPVVAVAGRLGMDVTRPSDDERLQVLLASCLGAASLLLLLRLLRAYLDAGPALLVAIALAFGSSLASTCGSALWSFDLEVVLLLAALGTAARWEQGLQSALPALRLGVLLGLAWLARPTALAALAAVALWLGLRAPRLLPRLLAGAGLVAAALVAHSMHVIGRPLLPYYEPGRWPRAPGVGAVLENAAALLVSPARGLLFFTPLLAVGLLGLRAREGRRLPQAALVGFILQLSALAVHQNWWGGWSFGPRLLTDAVPLLAVPLGAAAARLRSAGVGWPARGLLASLALFGVAVHTGRGLYARAVIDWNDRPNIDQSWDFYRWSFRNSQILATRRRNARKATAYDTAVALGAALGELPAGARLLAGEPDPDVRALFLAFRRRGIPNGKVIANAWRDLTADDGPLFVDGRRAAEAKARGLALSGAAMLAGIEVRAASRTGAAPAPPVARALPGTTSRLLGGPPPTRIVGAEDLATWLDVESHDLSRASSRWRSVQGRTLGQPDGLRVLDRAQDAWLELDLGCEGGEVDRVELATSGAESTTFRLFWATEVRGWSPHQQADARANPEGRVRFDVAGLPGWEGRVSQLRLGVIGSSASARPVVLLRLEARRLVPDASRLERLQGPVKVDIGNEVRDAELLLPGRARTTFALTPPDRATLSLALGRIAGARGDLRVRAVAAIDGESPRLLFERSPPHGGWAEVRVDLADLAHRALTISFEAAGSTGNVADGAAWLANPEVRCASHAPPSRPNVILISVDTLRADALSGSGALPPTSPNLDRFTRRHAVVFSQAISQAPWTLPSHTSLFSGRDATRHGVNQPGRVVPASMTLLAERLHEAGYATAAVTGGGAMHPRYGLSQGFERYAHASAREGDRELDWEMDRALSWVGENVDRPFFLFLHTYEVHDPYRERQPSYARLGGPSLCTRDAALPIGLQLHPAEASSGYLGRDHRFVWRGGPRGGLELRADEIGIVGARYASELAFVDARLAELLALLASRGVASRTLVALVSDHGEALGEDGRAGHGYLLESNVRVPLILALPGGAGAGRVIDAQVRLMDLAPTIIEAAGLAPLPGIEGRSLLPLVVGVREPVRESFTYAASMNFGLALRRPGRGTLELNNTAWPELLGRSAFQPGVAGAERELRARMREELAHVAGLRVSLRSPQQEPMSVRLSLPDLGPSMVKAVDRHARRIAFVPPHGVEVELAPGSRQELLLEVAALGRLAAVLGAGVEPCLIPLAPDARHAVADGGTLRAGEGPLPGGAAGIEIRWIGEAPSGDADPAWSDPDLRERLRALGYL